MKRSDFRFADPLRVRWAEVDMQKVVFNGHYLMYVDTAMGNWWRALALPYKATLEDLGGDLFVRKSTLEYLAPAHYDDALQVGIRFESAGTSSLRFVAAVFRGETWTFTPRTADGTNLPTFAGTANSGTLGTAATTAPGSSWCCAIRVLRCSTHSPPPKRRCTPTPAARGVPAFELELRALLYPTPGRSGASVTAA